MARVRSRTTVGFKLEIDGCPTACRNVLVISIDQTTIDLRETTTGLDVEYRVFGPGDAATSRSARSSCAAR